MGRTLKATNPKEAKPKKPKILIFGKPGAGKTWASLDFPSVYYIDTEGGASLDHYTDKLAKSGGVYLGPDQGSNDFNVVLDEIITLATTPHQYKTLVIDSYSKLFNTQVDTSLEKLTRESKEKSRDFDPTKTFGAEKKEAITFTRRMIRWFDKLDMNVILICHEKAMWKDGKEVGHTFDGWDKLEYELNLALHIVKQGASRKARITDKTRLLGFPPNEVFDWSYAGFAERYGRDIMETEAAPVQMATKEQVDEFNRLLGIVKVPPKTLEKWEENGDPEDLTSDDLKARINWLNEQIKAAAK